MKQAFWILALGTALALVATVCTAVVSWVPR